MLLYKLFYPVLVKLAAILVRILAKLAKYRDWNRLSLLLAKAYYAMVNVAYVVRFGFGKRNPYMLSRLFSDITKETGNV